MQSVHVVELLTMTRLILVSHWALFWFLLVGPFHVYARPWDGAQHTSVQQIPEYQGTTPAPTTAPSIPERDLLPRQQSEICGFANADISKLLVHVSAARRFFID